MVDAEGLADQSAVGGEHGYDGEFGSDINTDDKIMKELGHESSTSFPAEWIRASTTRRMSDSLASDTGSTKSDPTSQTSNHSRGVTCLFTGISFTSSQGGRTFISLTEKDYTTMIDIQGEKLDPDPGLNDPVRFSEIIRGRENPPRLSTSYKGGETFGSQNQEYYG